MKALFIDLLMHTYHKFKLLIEIHNKFFVIITCDNLREK
jgi:hypothetical protein